MTDFNPYAGKTTNRKHSIAIGKGAYAKPDPERQIAMRRALGLNIETGERDNCFFCGEPLGDEPVFADTCHVRCRDQQRKAKGLTMNTKELIRKTVISNKNPLNPDSGTKGGLIAGIPIFLAIIFGYNLFAAIYLIAMVALFFIKTKQRSNF